MTRKIKKIKPIPKPKEEKHERHIRYLVPKTDGQQRLVDAIENNQLIICVGPAGSGKTALSVSFAIKQLVENRIDKIIISRPLITGGGEEIGALPGDLATKCGVFLVPINEELEKILSVSEVTKLKNEHKIEIVPLAYMRGRNFHNCVVVIDEAQNCTKKQIKMIVTRLGQNAKIIIIGDVEQSDLHDRDNKLQAIYNSLNKTVEEVGTVTLDDSDVVRNSLIPKILKAIANV